MNNLNGISKLKEMRERVKDELNHIPTGSLNQNIMRQGYWMSRMRSLGKKGDPLVVKEKILAQSIAFVKKDDASYEPQYDKKYFDENKVKEELNSLI